MVYNDTEWVAYMDDEIKAARSAFYDRHNFAGTTDWAVDLQEFRDVVDTADMEPCDKSYSTLDELEKQQDSIPPHCLERYITDVNYQMLTWALKEFESLTSTDEYDRKFKVYEGRLKEMFSDQMDEFLAGDKTKDYFTCTELEKAGKEPSRFVDITCPSYYPFGLLGHASEQKKVTFHLKDSKGFLDRFGQLRDTSGHDELAVWHDISDAVSVPSLMVVDAVRSMKTLFQQVEEMEKKELTESLITWFSAVAMLLPLAGQAAATAGMTLLRTAFHGTALFLEVNVLALEIVNDPDNALTHVLHFVLGEGIGVALGKLQIAGAALARRTMKRGVMKQLGGAGKDLDRIDAIRMVVC